MDDDDDTAVAMGCVIDWTIYRVLSFEDLLADCAARGAFDAPLLLTGGAGARFTDEEEVEC